MFPPGPKLQTTIILEVFGSDLVNAELKPHPKFLVVPHNNIVKCPTLFQYALLTNVKESLPLSLIISLI